MAELRNRDGKHKLCVHPPIFAVPSQRNAHHFQSSSLSEQADNGERFRSLSEPRRQRGKADPPRSARSAKVPPHHLQSASRQRPRQRRARRLGGPHGPERKRAVSRLPYRPLGAVTGTRVIALQMLTFEVGLSAGTHGQDIHAFIALSRAVVSFRCVEHGPKSWFFDGFKTFHDLG